VGLKIVKIVFEDFYWMDKEDKRGVKKLGKIKKNLERKKTKI